VQRLVQPRVNLNAGLHRLGPEIRSGRNFDAALLVGELDRGHEWPSVAGKAMDVRRMILVFGTAFQLRTPADAANGAVESQAAQLDSCGIPQDRVE
jgi:hypothetical protein